MKKFVSGIIVGALLFAGTSAFAGNVSLIGQKVQGLYSVEKEGGTKVADAVVINGSAYAPVRAISDAVGTGLSVEGKRIIIQEKEIAALDITSGTKKNQVEIEKFENAIEEQKSEISKYEAFLQTEKAKLASAETEEARENYRASIDMLQINIKQAQEYIKNYEAQLAELQK